MADKKVTNPTYMANIRHFFTAGDKACISTGMVSMRSFVRAISGTDRWRVQENALKPCLY